MEFEEQDIDVITLLATLKESDENYPAELMTSRRQGYLKQIAALSRGADISAALKAGFAAFINRQRVLHPYGNISSLPLVEQISVNESSSCVVRRAASALTITDLKSNR